MKSNHLIFILLAAAAAFACIAAFNALRPRVAPNWQAAQRGVVLDAATRQPVAGAYVVARWLERSGPAFGALGVEQGRCLDRVVVRTDAQGNYTIPAPAAGAPDAGLDLLHQRRYFRDVAAYAVGYRRAAAVAEANDVLALETDARGPTERLAEFSAAAQAFECSSQSGAVAIAAALDAEAYALACLPQPGASEAQFARLRATLWNTGQGALAAHPCLQQHVASAAAP